MSPDCEKELEMLQNKSEKHRLNRKDDQLRNENALKDQAMEIKANLMKNESPDIREHMLYERRTWITEYYEAKEGKDLPQDIEDFYERHNVRIPPTPEEEEMLKSLSVRHLPIVQLGGV